MFLDLLVFLIPVYFANASPVVLGGGMPIDLGKDFLDGKRMLGSGKTIRGFIGGVFAGTLAAGLIALVYQLPYFPTAQGQFTAGFVLSLGVMMGDSLGSFIKRRLGRDSGGPFVPDTFMFLLVALILVFPLAEPSLYEPVNLLFFFIVTMVLHPLTNFLANQAGLKSVPW